MLFGHLAFLVLVVALGAVAVCLVPDSGLAAPKAAKPPRVDRILGSFYAWMNSKWTDPDGPYAKIRAKIDGDLSAGVPPADVLQKVLAAYPASDDPANIFARGYVSAVTASNFDEGSQNAAEGFSLHEDVGLAIFYHLSLYPHTYNFARLAFLILGDVGNGAMLNVGKRLLKRDPSDEKVQAEIIAVLLLTGKDADRDLAKKIAGERLASHPNDPV